MERFPSIPRPGYNTTPLSGWNYSRQNFPRFWDWPSYNKSYGLGGGGGGGGGMPQLPTAPEVPAPFVRATSADMNLDQAHMKSLIGQALLNNQPLESEELPPWMPVVAGGMKVLDTVDKPRQGFHGWGLGKLAGLTEGGPGAIGRFSERLQTAARDTDPRFANRDFKDWGKFNRAVGKTGEDTLDFSDLLRGFGWGIPENETTGFWFGRGEEGGGTSAMLNDMSRFGRGTANFLGNLATDPIVWATLGIGMKAKTASSGLAGAGKHLMKGRADAIRSATKQADEAMNPLAQALRARGTDYPEEVARVLAGQPMPGGAVGSVRGAKVAEKAIAETPHVMDAARSALTSTPRTMGPHRNLTQLVDDAVAAQMRMSEAQAVAQPTFKAAMADAYKGQFKAGADVIEEMAKNAPKQYKQAKPYLDRVVNFDALDKTMLKVVDEFAKRGQRDFQRFVFQMPFTNYRWAPLEPLKHVIGKDPHRVMANMTPWHPGRSMMVAKGLRKLPDDWGISKFYEDFAHGGSRAYAEFARLQRRMNEGSQQFGELMGGNVEEGMRRFIDQKARESKQWRNKVPILSGSRRRSMIDELAGASVRAAKTIDEKTVRGFDLSDIAPSSYNQRVVAAGTKLADGTVTDRPGPVIEVAGKLYDSLESAKFDLDDVVGNVAKANARRAAHASSNHATVEETARAAGRQTPPPEAAAGAVRTPTRPKGGAPGGAAKEPTETTARSVVKQYQEVDDKVKRAVREKVDTNRKKAGAPGVGSAKAGKKPLTNREKAEALNELGELDNDALLASYEGKRVPKWVKELTDGDEAAAAVKKPVMESGNYAMVTGEKTTKGRHIVNFMDDGGNVQVKSYKNRRDAVRFAKNHNEKMEAQKAADAAANSAARQTKSAREAARKANTAKTPKEKAKAAEELRKSTETRIPETRAERQAFKSLAEEDYPEQIRQASARIERVLADPEISPESKRITIMEALEQQQALLERSYAAGKSSISDDVTRYSSFNLSRSPSRAGGMRYQVGEGRAARGGFQIKTTDGENIFVGMQKTGKGGYKVIDPKTNKPLMTIMHDKQGKLSEAQQRKIVQRVAEELGIADKLPRSERVWTAAPTYNMEGELTSVAGADPGTRFILKDIGNRRKLTMYRDMQLEDGSVILEEVPIGVKHANALGDGTFDTIDDFVLAMDDIVMGGPNMFRGLLGENEDMAELITALIRDAFVPQARGGSVAKVFKDAVPATRPDGGAWVPLKLGAAVKNYRIFQTKKGRDAAEQAWLTLTGVDERAYQHGLRYPMDMETEVAAKLGREPRVAGLADDALSETQAVVGLRPSDPDYLGDSLENLMRQSQRGVDDPQAVLRGHQQRREGIQDVLGEYTPAQGQVDDLLTIRQLTEEAKGPRGTAAIQDVDAEEQLGRILGGKAGGHKGLSSAEEAMNVRSGSEIPGDVPAPGKRLSQAGEERLPSINAAKRHMKKARDYISKFEKADTVAAQARIRNAFRKDVRTDGGFASTIEGLVDAAGDDPRAKRDLVAWALGKTPDGKSRRELFTLAKDVTSPEAAPSSHAAKGAAAEYKRQALSGIDPTALGGEMYDATTDKLLLSVIGMKSNSALFKGTNAGNIIKKARANGVKSLSKDEISVLRGIVNKVARGDIDVSKMKTVPTQLREIAKTGRPVYTDWRQFGIASDDGLFIFMPGRNTLTDEWGFYIKPVLENGKAASLASTFIDGEMFLRGNTPGGTRKILNRMTERDGIHPHFLERARKAGLFDEAPRGRKQLPMTPEERALHMRDQFHEKGMFRNERDYLEARIRGMEPQDIEGVTPVTPRQAPPMEGIPRQTGFDPGAIGEPSISHVDPRFADVDPNAITREQWEKLIGREPMQHQIPEGMTRPSEDLPFMDAHGSIRRARMGEVPEEGILGRGAPEPELPHSVRSLLGQEPPAGTAQRHTGGPRPRPGETMGGAGVRDVAGEFAAQPATYADMPVSAWPRLQDVVDHQGQRFHLEYVGSRGQVGLQAVDLNGELIDMGTFDNAYQAKEFLNLMTGKEHIKKVSVLSDDAIEEAIEKLARSAGWEHLLDDMPTLRAIVRGLQEMEQDAYSQMAKMESAAGIPHDIIPNYIPGYVPRDKSSLTMKGRHHKKMLKALGQEFEEISGEPAAGIRTAEDIISSRKPISFDDAGRQAAALRRENILGMIDPNVSDAPSPSFTYPKQWHNLQIRLGETGTPFETSISTRAGKRVRMGIEAVGKNEQIETVAGAMGRAARKVGDDTYQFENGDTVQLSKLNKNLVVKSYDENTIWQLPNSETAGLYNRIVKEVDAEKYRKDIWTRFVMPLMTVTRPAFTITNTVGNFDFVLRNGHLTPNSIMRTLPLMSRLAGLRRGLGNFGKNQGDDLIREMMEHGVFSNPRTAVHMAEITQIGDINRINLNKMPGIGNWINRWQTMNTWSENFFRGAVYTHSRSQGLPPAAASREVNRVMLDYFQSSLTGAERTVRKFVPFYTWSRRNIPASFEMLMERPGFTYQAYFNQGPRAFSESSERMSDGSLADMSPNEYLERWQEMPRFQRLASGPALFGEDSYTRTRWPMNDFSEFGAILDEASQTLTGHDRPDKLWQETRDWAGRQLGPGLKLAAELSTGQNFETGADLADESKGEGVSDAVRRAFVNAIPTLGPLIRQWERKDLYEESEGSKGDPHTMQRALRNFWAAQSPNIYDEDTKKVWARQETQQDAREYEHELRRRAEEEGVINYSSQEDIDVALEMLIEMMPNHPAAEFVRYNLEAERLSPGRWPLEDKLDVLRLLTPTAEGQDRYDQMPKFPRGNEHLPNSMRDQRKRQLLNRLGFQVDEEAQGDARQVYQDTVYGDIMGDQSSEQLLQEVIQQMNRLKGFPDKRTQEKLGEMEFLIFQYRMRGEMPPRRQLLDMYQDLISGPKTRPVEPYSGVPYGAGR